MRRCLSTLCVMACGVARADDGALGRDELDEPLTPFAAATRRTIGAPDQMDEIEPPDRWVPWPLVGPFKRVADVCKGRFELTCAEQTGLSTDFPDGEGDIDPGPTIRTFFGSIWADADDNAGMVFARLEVLLSHTFLSQEFEEQNFDDSFSSLTVVFKF